MRVKTDCKNTLTRAHTACEMQERTGAVPVRLFAAKSVSREVLYPRIDCKKKGNAMAYSDEIYETNARIWNITVSRILCRLA